MRTLHRTRAKALTAGVLASALLTVGLAGTSHAAEDLVLDHGHIDTFAVTWANNELKLQLQEDVTGSHVKHAPEDVLLKVKDEAKLTLPDPVPPSLSFLGEGGDEVYYLPQTQDQNLIWPGWSTEAVPAGVFTNPLKIQITDVTGPGDVFLWQTGSFGQSQSVLADGGYGLPGTINANAGVHVHSNWAFTEPGKYELKVKTQGTRVNGGGNVSTPTATYTFQVGTPAPVTTNLTVNGIEEHYHPGETVSLSATQSPQTDLDHYHWFTKAKGATEWVIVPSNATGSYSFATTAAHDGMQVVAKLYNDHHEVAAESAPITLHVKAAAPPAKPNPVQQLVTSLVNALNAILGGLAKK